MPVYGEARGMNSRAQVMTSFGLVNGMRIQATRKSWPELTVKAGF